MNAASPAAAAKKKREPFIHIVKRDAMPWYKSWAVRACAVLAALVVSAVVTIDGPNGLDKQYRRFKRLKENV